MTLLTTPYVREDIPEWHRQVIAALEGEGVHFHEGPWGSATTVVGIRPST